MFPLRMAAFCPVPAPLFPALFSRWTEISPSSCSVGTLKPDVREASAEAVFPAAAVFRLSSFPENLLLSGLSDAGRTRPDLLLSGLFTVVRTSGPSAVCPADLCPDVFSSGEIWPVVRELPCLLEGVLPWAVVKAAPCRLCPAVTGLPPDRL